MPGTNRFASLRLRCDIQWQILCARTKLDGQYRSRICGQPTLHFQVSFMYVAQRLALLRCFTAMELDTTHISGPRNALSRWNGKDALPDGLSPAFQIPLDLGPCTSYQVSGLVSGAKSVGLANADSGASALNYSRALGPPFRGTLPLSNVALMPFSGRWLSEGALSLRAVSPHECLACFSEAHPFPLSGRRLGFRND